MYPKQVHTMLTLPDHWDSFNRTHLVESLLRQAYRIRRHRAVVRCLVWASFEIGFVARWRRTAPQLHLVEGPPLTWRIGDYRYVYLPRIDDACFCRLRQERPPAVITRRVRGRVGRF